MALSRARIVEAAGVILDEYGLADLSMRRLADALGVQAGALYYHVRNKQSLLAAVADDILRDVGPVSSLAHWAHSYRRVLLCRRDGAELVASTRAMGLGEVDPTLPASDYVDPSRASVVLATLERFVLGSTLLDQTRCQLAALGVVEGFDMAVANDTFRAGVAMLEQGARISIDSMA